MKKKDDWLVLNKVGLPFLQTVWKRRGLIFLGGGAFPVVRGRSALASHLEYSSWLASTLKIPFMMVW